MGILIDRISGDKIQESWAEESVGGIEAPMQLVIAN
jgi:hypothetical protein